MSQATTPEFDYEMDFVTGQPYPIWEEARRACPVFQSHAAPTGFSERPMYTVTRFADVEALLRDGQRFSSSINAEHIGQYMGDSSWRWTAKSTAAAGTLSRTRSGRPRSSAGTRR